MGVTVFLGQKIGEGNGDEGGRIVGAGIWMFGLIGAVLTIDGVTLSPHSVYVCVLGGNSGAIATAMYRTVSAGCDTNGTTDYLVEDDTTGIKEMIHFQRPTDADITIRLKFPDAAGFSADDLAVIRQAVFNNFYRT